MSRTIEFYRPPDGGNPVQDWLDSLPVIQAARAAQGLDILRTYGAKLGMPHVRDNASQAPTVFGLRWRGKPEHRMFFVADGERLVILHGCTKSAPGTPPEDSAIARGRQQEYLKRKA